jgi:SAM-dependent methyltransferase
VSDARAERFWDERAREDAFHFVDTRVPYRGGEDERFWTGGEEAVSRMLEMLGVELEPTDVVVDIGCGIGRLTRALAARAGEVLALDVSSEMLARAQQLNAHLDNVRWLHGDGTTLAPVADSSADACFSHVVFNHIPDPAITLGYVREMGRVLRPGGWSAFQVSNDPEAEAHAPSGGAPLRRRVAALAGRAPRAHDDPAWLGSAVDLGALRRTASGAGLAVERVEAPGSFFCTILVRRES